MDSVLLRPGDAKAALLHEKGEAPLLLKNTDTSTNNVYLGESESFDISGTAFTTLRPLGTVSLIGIKDVYGKVAVNAPAAGIKVERMEASQVTSAPSDVALQIAASGLALDTSVNAPAYSPITTTNAGLLNKEATQATLAKDATVTGVAKTTDINNLHTANKTIAADVAGTDLTGTGLNKEATQTTLSKTTDINALHAGGHTIANEISTTGTPILRQNNSFGSATAQTLAGNSTATLQVITTILQPAIQLFLTTKFPLNTGTVPFVNINVTWFNAATGLICGQRNYFVSAGNNVAQPVVLLAPSRGDQIRVQITNLDPTTTLTYDWSLTGITHFVNDDDFTYVNSQNVNGFTLPGSFIAANILFSTAPTIAPNSSITRLLPATNRRCFLVVDNNNAPNNQNNMGESLTDPANLYALAGANIFYGHAASPSAGAILQEEMQLPNGPTLLTLSNIQATNSISPLVTALMEAIDA